MRRREFLLVFIWFFRILFRFNNTKRIRLQADKIGRKGVPGWKMEDSLVEEGWSKMEMENLRVDPGSSTRSSANEIRHPPPTEGLFEGGP